MNMNDEECDYETKRKQWRRGETPEDIQTECRNLCSQYLGGIWSEISENQLNIRRITGGFTNQIYYCGLSSQCATIGNEPQEVAVKCYGKKWISNYTENDRFNDIVINLLAAKHNLGPKQYAFFSRGNIEEYIKSHSFGLKEKSDGKYVDKLSRMLATFHSMDVPIARNENWFSKFLDDFYTKAYELFPLTEMFREVNATTLLNTNLKDEINWLKKCLKATNSPLVFSHNDFRGPNIMVREIDQNNDQSIAIAFCDFEYSCYAYRGFDFGAIFEDWGRTDAQEVCGRVSDFEIEQFMIGYLDENIKIHGLKKCLIIIPNYNFCKERINDFDIIST
ncbi:unnamed protein product [Medioppia subpectinata]|uniref:Choline kinase n=1 Tax=Medioppia subpectinata TaxID=1979941 RepID=A0A7R9LA20_9ACAR|nr:unnamed protein product [Medioppia subpectinata]CAG2117193.1 unnamed protein product [Medioppia subpectinata]